MALFFAIAISAIVGVYLNLATGDLILADSSFISNSLIHLAEEGAEEATWALMNDNVNWTGWTETVPGFKSMRITSLDLGNGKSGTILVVVEGYDSSTPIIYVEAQAQLPTGRIVSKQIMIELSGRSLFASGMISKSTLSFSGNISVDSYDSSISAYNTITNRNANITVGSISTTDNAVSMSGADVYGYVGSGGGDLDLNAANTTVTGPDTGFGVDRDPDRLSTSLSAQFEIPEEPDTADYTIDLPGGNTLNGSTTVTIGTAGGAVEGYSLISQLDIRANSTLIIDGPVVIFMDSNDINITGAGSIEVTPNGSLTIYGRGDFGFGGAGIVNTNANPVPSDIIIYGTATTTGTQEITISGSSSVAAVIYAPNADFTINGTPNTSGAVVANTITMTGSAAFHYDEALADFFGGGGMPDNFEMDSWLELTNISDRIDLSIYF